MTERRAGRSAQVALKIGSGAFVAHDDAAARTGLAGRNPEQLVERTLPGAGTVMLPVQMRGGQITWTVPRTAAVDRQLAAANNRTGQVRLRPLGAGSGAPQRIVDVLVRTRLVLTGGALPQWTVTALIAGVPDDTAQT